jgi:hypothetical protein
MKTRQSWLAAWTGLGLLMIGSSVALAQPKPITACGTTIKTPGSFVVTAILVATSSTAPCINVTSPAVTIDLGGFTLTGKGGSAGILSGSSLSTFVNDIASLNGRYGFNLVCPDNLLNVTAIGNKSGFNYNFTNLRLPVDKRGG